jgi:reactive intermediate/imine deaminase
MTIQRIGSQGSKGAGGQHLPFSRAVLVNGWLHVSGQVAMEKGEVIEGGIVAQSHKAIQNLLAILAEAGFEAGDVIRCGVWLDDPRDFSSFNKVFAEYFGAAPPARSCVVSSMVIDCKVEIDCVAYREPKG